VVGLEWSHDTESYAGGSVATGRISHSGQVKGYDPDKKQCTGPPCWGLADKPTLKNFLIVEKFLLIAAGRKRRTGDESHRIGISDEQ
jgi:hypothetical protein